MIFIRGALAPCITATTSPKIKNKFSINAFTAVYSLLLCYPSSSIVLCTLKYTVQSSYYCTVYICSQVRNVCGCQNVFLSSSFYGTVCWNVCRW
jgi:hypothetical protein